MQQVAQLDLFVHGDAGIRRQEERLVDEHVAAGIAVGPRARYGERKHHAERERKCGDEP